MDGSDRTRGSRRVVGIDGVLRTFLHGTSPERKCPNDCRSSESTQRLACNDGRSSSRGDRQPCLQLDRPIRPCTNRKSGAPQSAEVVQHFPWGLQAGRRPTSMTLMEALFRGTRHVANLSLVGECRMSGSGFRRGPGNVAGRRTRGFEGLAVGSIEENA